VWDPATGKERQPGRGHQGAIACLTLTPDGKRLVTGGEDNTIRLWDPATGKEVQRLPGLGKAVRSMACAPDGKTLAVGGYPASVHLVDLKTGGERKLAEGGKEDWIAALAFSRDGKLLTWGESAGNICLWDPKAGEQVDRWGNPPRPTTALAFSSSGKVLLSSSHDYAVRAWDVRGTERRRTWPRKAHVRSAAWSPDRRTLAWGDKTIWLVEAATGKIRGQLPGHGSWVEALAFSTDGRCLASGSEEGTIRLWALDSGKLLRVLEGHRESVRGLVFFPDGKRLASASHDSTALVWEIAEKTKEEPQPKLQPKELQKLWDDLAGGDAVRAYQAIWTLAASPRQSVLFLQNHLKPVSSIDPKKLGQLTQDLGSDNYARRIKAMRELEQLGTQARTALEQVLEKHPPLEIRKRVELLLDRLKEPLTRDELRGLRAIEPLEYIGNAEAQKLLTQLAAGAADNPVTEEANETLIRLGHSAKR
jgi:WD40 repeat protein